MKFFLHKSECMKTLMDALHAVKIINEYTFMCTHFVKVFINLVLYLSFEVIKNFDNVQLKIISYDDVSHVK